MKIPTWICELLIIAIGFFGIHTASVLVHEYVHYTMMTDEHPDEVCLIGWSSYPSAPVFQSYPFFAGMKLEGWIRTNESIYRQYIFGIDSHELYAYSIQILFFIIVYALFVMALCRMQIS